MTISYKNYPLNRKIDENLLKIVSIFEKNEMLVSSEQHQLKSDDVLQVVTSDLILLGYNVEQGKKSADKILVPILYGQNGRADKYFLVDAYHQELGIVLEVEAGRAYSNHQFLKDLFQASVMVDVEFLVIAVRKQYRDSKDFNKIIDFMDTLYASDRLKLPLKSVLIIGY